MAMVKTVFVAVAAVVALAQLAAAVDHTVASWDASGTDYNTWSAAQKFTTKDSIVFNYAASHDVVEVSKAGYDACSASTPVASYKGGKTTVKLATAGKHYFICGIPGHCAAGMKLTVNVVAASTATPAKPRGQRSVAPVAAPVSAPAPAPEGPTDENMPNVSSPTGSTPSSAATIGAKAAVALAMGMAVALAM
uniref:Uncharacterized protein n=1 Tax=Avena sativa TaxID=4498 RepID=A0ACD5UY33_AVESA